MSRLRNEIAGLEQIGRPRVTAVRAGGLGDTLLVVPALQLLAQGLPVAELTLVGSAWAQRLLPLVDLPFSMLRFDSPKMTPLFAPLCPVDPTGAFAAAHAVIVYTAHADDEFLRNVRRFCPGPVVVWPVEPPPDAHAACHFAAAIVDPPPPIGALPRPALTVPPGAREWAEAWLKANLQTAEPPVCLHPGSGGARKCWPTQRFADLVRVMRSPTVILQGPADTAPCHALVEQMEGCVPFALASSVSVQQAAALLARGRLYVGNDSGMSHLAAALGVPTVAVFGPTDPAVWGPLGPAVRCVSSQGSDTWPPVQHVLSACRALLR